MNTLKDFLKASIWGMLLLTSIIIASSATFLAYSKTDDFYTSSTITGYKKTYAAISDALLDLEQYMIESERESEWDAHSDEAVKAVKDFIEKAINKNCASNCSALSFPTPNYSFEVSDFRSKLERLTNKEDTNSANYIAAFTFLMSLITILFSLYLLFGLLRYKKLTTNGLSILILLISPFLVISASFALPSANEYMTYDISANGIKIIFGCVIYIFTIFPPVIFMSKKREYSICKILKLDGLIKTI